MLLADDALQVGQGINLGPAQPAPHQGGVRVEGGHDLKAALGETAVVAEGLAEVTRSHQGDVVLAVEAELAVYLLAQQLGVIADAPRPVGPEVGKVFAHLGGVDAGPTGELIRGDGDHPVVVGLRQSLEVQREAFDGCLRQRPGGGESRGGRSGGNWHPHNGTTRPGLRRGHGYGSPGTRPTWPEAMSREGGRLSHT